VQVSQSLSGLVPMSLNATDRIAKAKLLIQGVSKRYGNPQDGVLALDRIDLAIQKNDFVCIVGPSGCGKSTLLNAVAGFERPTEGRIVLDGQLVRSPGAERGVVFQQGALFDWMTVLENVSFGPRACGRPVQEAVETAKQYIDLVGLSAFSNRYPHELSGGMQQRVGIARALANHPEVLLMDEPFAALDQQNRELLQGEIKGIWQKTGSTVLWITHSIEEALFLGTHVIVMSARPGRIKGSFKTNFDQDAAELVTSDAFFQAKRELYHLLREEAVAAHEFEQA
jgi:ABC-type nitrate/sulfonate/bicarbonate transport system ATPase subunit